MKILQVNKFFYRKGGSETYYFDLISLLNSKGHTIIPFSMQDSKNESSAFQEYFVKNLNLTNPSLLNLISKIPQAVYSQEAAEKLEKLITAEKPDIAHLHNIDRHITPSIIPVLKKHKIPMVMTLHDYKLICPNSTLFTQRKICEKCRGGKFYFAPLQRCIHGSLAVSTIGCLEAYVHRFLKLYNGVDLFLAPSQFLKNKFIEFGFPQEKLIHLPLFLSFDQSFKLKGQKRNDYFLYFGRLNEEKGLRFLISVFRKIPEIKLKIAGSGPLEQELKNLAGSNQNIEFLGYQEKNKLYNLIQGARAIVSPSLWYENASYSVMETMVLGKTVIASKMGGIPELIADNKTGFLFEPGNEKELEEKIRYCLDNPEKIVEIGETARKEAIRRFDPETHYRKLMSVYKQLLQNRAPRI